MRKRITFLVVISTILSFIYLNFKPPYKISKENVKSIYGTYGDNTGYYKVEVNDSDKEIILSEVSKMRKSSVSGEVGTPSCVFVIELNNGDKFTFTQNTKKTVSLYGHQTDFFRNIKAPKTAEFINRFMEENKVTG